MEKLNLPQNYSYKIVKIDFLSDISYSAAFRIAEVRNEESASLWIDSYQKLSNVVWRTARTFKCAGKYNIFRKDFRCQHNTDSRRRIKNVKISKNTNCQATLKIIVQSYLDNPDKTVKEFPCVIELHNVHNHAVDSAAALRFRDLSESTKEALKRLFHQGHSAASARWSLDMAFQINDAENYDRLVADASIFPSVSVIQHLFNNEFASLYGAKLGKDVISDLKAFCDNYSIVSAGKVSMKAVNNNIAVAICTPIMQRTATLLPQAKELILVDASGHMDVLNHRVYFFISPAVVGGAPVGCVITDVEKEEVFKTGVQLLQSCLPVNAAVTVSGPKVFMTDGDLKEKNALSSVWPNATYLLCQFHVLKAMWSWLCNVKNEIPACNRQEIFFRFKEAMYVKTETEFQQKISIVEKIDIFQKSKKLQTYFSTLLGKKTLWASCFRNGLPIRGNNTNNYIEVVFRVLKDTVLNRVKAYSVIQLVDFIVTGYENYLHRRYLDFSYGRYTKSLLKKFIATDDSNDSYNISFDSKEQHFLVEKSKQTYFVDAQSSYCTCYIGATGQYCKHIAAVAKESNISNAFMYSEMSRSLMYEIATGNPLPSKSFLKPLTYNPNSLESKKSHSFIDAGTSSIPDMLNFSAPSISNNQSDDELNDEEEFLIIKDIFNKIKEGRENNPEIFKRAVKKMAANYKKYAKTETGLVAAMHNFAKYSGPKSVLNPKRKGTQIPVQPTAIGRRVTLFTGKRKKEAGKPPGMKQVDVALRDHISCVMPVSKRKAPHNLVSCVDKNVSLGRDCSAK